MERYQFSALLASLIALDIFGIVQPAETKSKSVDNLGHNQVMRSILMETGHFVLVR
jgi:hypothetical protein